MDDDDFMEEINRGRAERLQVATQIAMAFVPIAVAAHWHTEQLVMRALDVADALIDEVDSRG